VDLEAVELYGLTPDEFIAARNQLAKTVGGTTGAVVKALPCRYCNSRQDLRSVQDRTGRVA
jgi:hypothetical protein